MKIVYNFKPAENWSRLLVGRGACYLARFRARATAAEVASAISESAFQNTLLHILLRSGFRLGDRQQALSIHHGQRLQSR